MVSLDSGPMFPAKEAGILVAVTVCSVSSRRRIVAQFGDDGSESCKRVG